LHAKSCLRVSLPTARILCSIHLERVSTHLSLSPFITFINNRFCSNEIQQEYLEKQFQTFDALLGKLPLFLHNRSVGPDLLEVLKKDKRRQRGVVHSFDDTLELALQFIELGLYIGLNGCSLKTEENLNVVKELPLDKILLETDCPYCEIKQSHAGFHYIKTQFEKKTDKKFELGKMVKGRNEPCQMVQVAEVIAGVKGIDVQEVADRCYQNSLELYGWK
jgi:TatD DNase family protein